MISVVWFSVNCGIKSDGRVGRLKDIQKINTSNLTCKYYVCNGY